MKQINKKVQEGFTLIEILVVIGLIAILAAIVIIAINPARQFAQGRNTQRTSNVEAILNAIGQRMADNKGVFSGVGIDGQTCPTLPSALVAVPNTINSANVGSLGALRIASGGAAGTIDLGCLTPTYISALPYDPSAANANWTSATSYDTEYYVVQDNIAGSRITVFAENPELALGAATQNYITITR